MGHYPGPFCNGSGTGYDQWSSVVGERREGEKEKVRTMLEARLDLGREG